MEIAVANLPQANPGPSGFTGEFHQIFKEEYNWTQTTTSVYTSNLSNCILLKILNLLYINYISRLFLKCSVDGKW